MAVGVTVGVHRGLRRGIAVLVAAQVLVLSGCSEEEPVPIMPEPSTPSASTSTEAPTETPSVDPLAIPAAAREKTKAGAEALVRHYFEMNNHFVATGDAKPVRRLYRDGCSLCEVPVATIEFSQSKGHTWTGAETIRRLQVESLGTTGGLLDMVAFVTLRQSQFVERNREGKLLLRFPARRGEREYFLTYQSGRWGITNAEATP